MKRRDVLAALLALAGCSGLRTSRGGDPRFDELTLEAKGIGPMRVTLRVPPGEGPHPVLYMHDGQNLFDPAKSGYGKVWHVDRAVERLAASGRIAPPLIVGVWNNGVDRVRTYLPKPAYDRLPEAARTALAPWLPGPVLSEAYLDFLTGTLKPAIDRAYPTRSGRDDTVIMGSSMGGLISLHALVRHPSVYGGAGCLSTHWPIFLPAENGDDAPFTGEVIAAWTDWLGEALGPPQGRRIWFDHGTATLDALYAPYQGAIDALLPRLGWERGEDFMSRVYPGAEHEENAWAARMADPLAFLLG